MDSPVKNTNAFAGTLFFFVLSWILSIHPVCGQSAWVRDAVYLKNGSIIRGRIMPDTTDRMIRLRTMDESVWVFRYDEIDSLKRESFRESFRTRGYQSITGFGVLAGSGNNTNNTIFSVNTIHGLRFMTRWFAGGGTGIEFFGYPVVPLYADLQYRLLSGRVSNVIHLKAGYALALEKPVEPWGYHYTAKGGPLLGAGMGLEIFVNQRNALVIELGYRFQDLYVYYTTDWQTEKVKETTTFNRLSISLAIKIQ